MFLGGSPPAEAGGLPSGRVSLPGDVFATRDLRFLVAVPDAMAFDRTGQPEEAVVDITNAALRHPSQDVAGIGGEFVEMAIPSRHVLHFDEGGVGGGEFFANVTEVAPLQAGEFRGRSRPSFFAPCHGNDGRGVADGARVDGIAKLPSSASRIHGEDGRDRLRFVIVEIVEIGGLQGRPQNRVLGVVEVVGGQIAEIGFQRTISGRRLVVGFVRGSPRYPAVLVNALGDAGEVCGNGVEIFHGFSFGFFGLAVPSS